MARPHFGNRLWSLYGAVRTNWYYTARIFLADSLENGAGYASHIGTIEFFRGLLENLLEYGYERFAAREHSLLCDTSCPDCLRSYDNRQVHALLDWRLALDISEVIAGKSLDTSRWFGQVAVLTAPILETLSDDQASLSTIGPLQAIMSPTTRKVAILSHPLWSTDFHHINSTQATSVAEAMDIVRRMGANNPNDAVRIWDLWTLARRPHLIIEWLNT